MSIIVVAYIAGRRRFFSEFLSSFRVRTGVQYHLIIIDKSIFWFKILVLLMVFKLYIKYVDNALKEE